MERMNKFQGVNVYVKNLDEGVTEDAMREAFAQYGTITRYVCVATRVRAFFWFRSACRFACLFGAWYKAVAVFFPFFFFVFVFVD